MIKKSIVSGITLSTLLLAQCTSSKAPKNPANAENGTTVDVPKPPTPPTPPPIPLTFTYTPNARTVDFQDMDGSVDPSVDFFDFANGKWIKNTPIPGTEASWGKFNILSDNNNKVLKEILESTAKQKNDAGTVNQLIGDFYYTIMDSVKREADGIKPIQNELNAINALKDKKDLAKYIGHLHRFGFGSLFGTQVEQDLKDNSRMVFYISQGGISLPSSEYYTKKDTASEEIKKAYRAHLKTMFGFINLKPAEADLASQHVFAIEAMLADSSLTPLEERDIQSQYNKKTWAELKKICPSFNWDVYAKEIGITTPLAEVIVSVPKALRAMEKVITSKSLPEIKNYLRWKVLMATGNKLSIQIERQQFAFFGTTLRGAKQMKPLWKRAIGAIGGTAVSEALGHAFVDKTFSPEAKKRVNEMVDNIFIAFKQRLDTLEWMSAETRAKAHLKLSTFIRKLGYPDNWTDFSKLSINRTSFVQNVMACEEFNQLKNIQKLYKPIDKTEWQMPPHIVNSYYNPL